MSEANSPKEKVLAALQERAKELNCLYEVEEVLSNSDAPVEQVFRGVLAAIPPGWRHPEICRAKISYSGQIYTSPGLVESPWVQCAEIEVQQQKVGSLCVYYIEERLPSDIGPFLNEEVRLIQTIADRLGQYLQHQQLRKLFSEFRTAQEESAQMRKGEWRGALHLLRKTDQSLYARIARKMMNHLCWSGIDDALMAMQRAGEDLSTEEVDGFGNYPSQKRRVDQSFFMGDEPFEIAAQYLSDDEIFQRVERWIFEDKSSFVVKVLANQQSSLSEIVDAIRRFSTVVPKDVDLSRSTLSGMRVSLIRRFLTEQLEFIMVAKKYIEVSDFLELLDRMILPAGSHGKLGGKSAGLFLATQVLKRAMVSAAGGITLKVPRSWYIASDGLLDFIEFNNMEEVIEHKYREIDEVRQEYPHLIQLFKNAKFSPEMIKGLSMALDDFQDRPLIVRSSSLLEDRLGMAFSGKYKSLFLANQGSKQKRLEALLDAIAEIYASTFGPDPIEYRRERNLIDFNEEMGILIQEVVGTKVGRYYLPAFAGVAFSNNEFRWSPRIKREDGLLRMVPGLGTRAVDRLGDDYPILVAPGQPNLRANVSSDEIVRYSPKKLDVINLENNCFETVDVKELIAECGTDYPGFAWVFSLFRDDQLKKPVGLLLDPTKEELVVTCNGLISDTPFVQQMYQILTTLQQSLGTPVDVEFASDGKDIYLLQCRPQSYFEDNVAVAIPRDLPKEDILFSANRYVSNGLMPDITHIVYVDPEKYNDMENLSDLIAVGRAVGKLNQLLPKRQFILMGPGRWGSRGDIKLGVNVTYSDINNSAMLIEIARKKGNYLPDLSFGTHFFQDLVESSIRYLPLYPDDPGIVFNSNFLTTAPNILASLLPESEHLLEVLRVIDVPLSTRGTMVLRVLMNADLEQAVGVLVSPTQKTEKKFEKEQSLKKSDDHWHWRMQMAERLAAELDPMRFGVQALYLFGSTKNGTAGPGSDIDMLVHFRGSSEQRELLSCWLEGWSQALSETNYLRSGHRCQKMLDAHFITDDDIAKHTDFAAKIGAITDAAKRLPLKGDPVEIHHPEKTLQDQSAPKVLIVDDEPAIRDLIAAYVRREGFTPLLAANTAEAWDELDKEPNLVFLDVDMPGETGVSLVLRLREKKLHLKTAIVFVTAYPERCGFLQSAGLGAMEVISKPFRKEQIVSTLHKYCAKPSTQGGAPKILVNES